MVGFPHVHRHRDPARRHLRYRPGQADETGQRRHAGPGIWPRLRRMAGRPGPGWSARNHAGHVQARPGAGLPYGDPRGLGSAPDPLAERWSRSWTPTSSSPRPGKTLPCSPCPRSAGHRWPGWAPNLTRRRCAASPRRRSRRSPLTSPQPSWTRLPGLMHDTARRCQNPRPRPRHHDRLLRSQDSGNPGRAG
jgi:hypothetical protein